MEVTINTSEATKGLLGKTTTYTIHAKIKLTPEERLLWDSEDERSSIYELCLGHKHPNAGETEHKTDALDFITLRSAIEGGGSCTALTPSGLKMREAEILQQCKKFKAELDDMKGYEVNKEYTVTIGEE